jgi:hypothetical protein
MLSIFTFASWRMFALACKTGLAAVTYYCDYGTYYSKYYKPMKG